MDTQSRGDPVEALYDARIRGACVISTRDGRRLHFHGGCWVTACAHEPPRLLVAFAKEFEGAAIVQRGRRFAVSLVAEDQWEMHDRMFGGGHTLDALGRQGFLSAPSGCPVLGGGVAYLDCELAEAIDLGDFLVAVGDLRAAAVLHPEGRNLTVNQILRRRGVPREARLPFHGFDDDTRDLAPVPQEGAGAEALDRAYGCRRWGAFLVTAHADGRDHLHVGSWAIQCSHRPPRMLVSVERRSPVAGAIGKSGAFALSLLAEDQLGLAVAVARGAAEPAAVPGAALRRETDGAPLVLGDALAHFRCSVEGEFNAGADCAGFYGPVGTFAAGRTGVPQLRDDQLAAARGGGAPDA